MVAYLTIASFTTALLTPPLLIASNGGLTLNDINFSIKVEKIYEKVKRAIKIVRYMFKFKEEVEQDKG